jgi:hypothetical protein
MKVFSVQCFAYFRNSFGFWKVPRLRICPGKNMADKKAHGPLVEWYKGKGHPITGHEGPEVVWRYRSTLSLISALGGVGGKRHAPAALPLVKARYPLYRRLVGPRGRSGQVRKISPPTGFDPRTVQPVASPYTDCGIPQWCTEGVVLGGSTPLPKFKSFDKAKPISRFRGKYIRNNRIRIRVSLICKLSGTPD